MKRPPRCSRRSSRQGDCPARNPATGPVAGLGSPACGDVSLAGCAFATGQCGRLGLRNAPAVAAPDSKRNRLRRNKSDTLSGRNANRAWLTVVIQITFAVAAVRRQQRGALPREGTKDECNKKHENAESGQDRGRGADRLLRCAYLDRMQQPIRDEEVHGRAGRAVARAASGVARRLALATRALPVRTPATDPVAGTPEWWCRWRWCGYAPDRPSRSPGTGRGSRCPWHSAA